MFLGVFTFICGRSLYDKVRGIVHGSLLDFVGIISVWEMSCMLLMKVGVTTVLKSFIQLVTIVKSRPVDSQRKTLSVGDKNSRKRVNVALTS